MGDRLLDSLSATERRAVALIGLMIRLHGGREGDGLFTGAGRYAALERRVRLGAERSRTVRQCWDTVARTMRWSLTRVALDGAVLALIAPADDDGEVLRTLADRTQSCVMIARHLERMRRASDSGPVAAIDDALDVFALDGGRDDADEIGGEE